MFRTSVPNGDSVCCSFFYILRLLFHWKERRGRNKWITCYSLHSNYSPSLDVQHKGHFLVTLSSNFLDVIQGENSEEGIDSTISVCPGSSYFLTYQHAPNVQQSLGCVKLFLLSNCHISHCLWRSLLAGISLVFVSISCTATSVLG